MRKLHPPRPGAIRSYVSRGGVFVVSHLHPRSNRGTAAGRNAATGQSGWELFHQPSGATVAASNYAEAIDVVRRIQTPPDASEGESGRWVILPRPLPMGGQVLFDRASGRWWGRDAEHPVMVEELEAMASLRPLESFQHEIKLTPAAANIIDDADVTSTTNINTSSFYDSNKKTARRRS